MQQSTAQVPLIALEGVGKWYGAYHALKDINLTVRKGEKSSFAGHPARENRH